MRQRCVSNNALEGLFVPRPVFDRFGFAMESDLADEDWGKPCARGGGACARTTFKEMGNPKSQIRNTKQMRNQKCE
jgi:hypothetical protein